MTRHISTTVGSALLGISLLLSLVFISSSVNEFESTFTKVSSISQLAQVAPSSGLVAHYTFDEGSGTTAGDSAGSNTGTLLNGPTWVSGKVGGALQFDGVDDYVNTNNKFATTQLSTSKTISVWAKADSTSSGYPICVVRGYGGVCGFAIGASNGNWVGKYWTSTTATITSNVPITLGQWVLLTLVQSGTTVTMYADGIVVANANNAGTVDTVSVNTYIGARNNNINAQDYFRGTLDDVRIYNRVLTPAEVTDLYNYTGGSTPPPTEDITFPIISAITTSSITSTGATISWTTNEPADTQIEYGPTTAYGSNTTLNTSLVTSHSQTLSGLIANTTYHYRVKSRDAANNQAQSSDMTFTTSAVVTPPVGTNTFYIRDGGASTVCTDWSNACDSLPASLQRGATYYIADGIYPGYMFDDPVDENKYITIKKATQLEHGTQVGWNNSYGDGFALWQPTLMFVSNYYVFDGVTGGGPGSWDSGHGFKMQNDSDVIFLMLSNKWGAPSQRVDVSNITIRHVEVAGHAPAEPGIGTGLDATAYGAKFSNIVVAYSYFHDFGRPMIYMINGDDLIVEYSYFARNAGSPTHHNTAIRNDKVNRAIYKWNLFSDIVSTGWLGMYGGTFDSPQIYGNVFYDTPGFTGGYGNGVIFTTGSDKGVVNNARIYNNSFVNLPSGNLIMLNFSGVGGTGNLAYNNIFYQLGGSPTFSSNVSRDYNWYAAPSGTFGETNAQSGSGDPFVDWRNKDFRLAARTDSGMSLPTPFNVDAKGIIRGADGVWDRGAYEYTGSVTPPKVDTTPPQRGMVYYVDNSLNTNCISNSYSINLRNCTGSDGNAYKTIQEAVNVANTPGDLINVRNGTYSENINTVYSGNSVDFITIQAFNFEKPILYDASHTTGAGFSINNQYIKIKGFEFTGYGASSDGQRASIFVNRGGSHAYISNNYIHDTSKELPIYFIPGRNYSNNWGGVNKGTRAVYIKEPNMTIPAASRVIMINNKSTCTGHVHYMLFGNDHFLDNNIMQGCDDAKGLNWNDYDAVWLFGNNIIVSNNIIKNLDGSCGDANQNCSTGSAHNHTDAFQTFGNSVLSPNASNVIIENNFIHNGKYAQIAQLTSDGQANIRNWTFRNNIFANWGMKLNTYLADTKIYNNIFYNVENASLGGNEQSVLQFNHNNSTGDTAVNGEVFNNMFLNNSPTRDEQGWYYNCPTCIGFRADYNYVSKGDYGAKTNFHEEHGVNGGNPYLVNIGGSNILDWSPTSLSTIIVNKAISIAGFSTDIVGNPRGSTWDIGAYEYTGAVVTPPSAYTITATKSGTGQGTITGTGLSCTGNTCTATVNNGSSITLTATPSTGSTFTGWSNGCTGTSTCTLSSSGSVTATFTTTVVEDMTPPTVSLTSPSGTISGTVSLVATASDNVGVVSVRFLLDGVNIEPLFTTAPYTGTWNTIGISNGTHTLTAVARDLAGNTTTSLPVTINISNIITPNNTAPVVSAGLDKSITLPNTSATLTGTATDDGLPLGSTLSTTWSRVSGPSTVMFANNNPSTSITITQPGTYILRLTATDGDRSSSDDVTVTVIGDTRAPVRSLGLPATTLPYTTTATTLSLRTDESATCLWSNTPNTPISSMVNTFSGANSTTHTYNFQPLSPNTSYNIHVKCRDLNLNANTDDYNISFSVAPTPISPSLDEDMDGIPNTTDLCLRTPPALRTSVNKDGCPKPRTDKFDIKPNFHDLDLRSVSNLELGISTHGKVRFTSSAPLIKDTTLGALTYKDQLDIDTNLNIQSSTISLDSTSLPELNIPAEITLYNVTYQTPKILRDGVECTVAQGATPSACTPVSYTNNTYVFTVTGFSTYTLEEGAVTPPPTNNTPTGGGGGSSGGSSPTGTLTPTVTQLPIYTANTITATSQYSGLTPITRNLYKGLSGEDVRTLQRFLVIEGLLTIDTPTTYYGLQTEAAVKLFQAQNGIVSAGTPETTGYGRLGPKTRVAINAKLQNNTTITPITQTSGTITMNLYRGIRDQQVAILQTFLKQQGYLTIDNVTTYYGPKTEAAVKAFQCAKAIVCSGTPNTTGFGKVGPRTRANIN